MEWFALSRSVRNCEHGGKEIERTLRHFRSPVIPTTPRIAQVPQMTLGGVSDEFSYNEVPPNGRFSPLSGRIGLLMPSGRGTRRHLLCAPASS